MEKENKASEAAGLLGGVLNILGLKIDLGELMSSPESLKERLEELRERLKQMGGEEVLSDEDWISGRSVISGHIRTSGILGDREYHMGTSGRPREARRPSPEPPEVVEPPVDIFDQADEVTIVADVPGAGLDDLDLKLEGTTFSLSTSTTARRHYRKELRLKGDLEPEGMQATCRNGVLEVRIRKRTKSQP